MAGNNVKLAAAWSLAVQAARENDVHALAKIMSKHPRLKNLKRAVRAEQVHVERSLLYVAAISGSAECFEYLTLSEMGNMHEEIFESWIGKSGWLINEHTPLTIAIMCEDDSKRERMAATAMSKPIEDLEAEKSGWQKAMLAAAFWERGCIMEQIFAHVGHRGQEWWPSATDAKKCNILHIAGRLGSCSVLRVAMGWPGMEQCASQVDVNSRTPEELARALCEDDFADELAARVAAIKEARELSGTTKQSTAMAAGQPRRL